VKISLTEVLSFK